MKTPPKTANANMTYGEAFGCNGGHAPFEKDKRFMMNKKGDGLAPVTDYICAAESCWEIYKTGARVSKAYPILIPKINKVRALWCDMKEGDGGWMLVGNHKCNVKTRAEQFPWKGAAYDKLAANDDYALSSLSMDEMNALHNAYKDTVLKMTTWKAKSGQPWAANWGKQVTFWLQRAKHSASFNLFHAIRNVELWGAVNSGYRIRDDKDGKGAYNPKTNYVTHDGGTMNVWDKHTHTIHGKAFVMSRHGIPGDHKRGCEWAFTFHRGQCSDENNCNASFCYGSCHSWNSKTPAHCPMKLWIKGIKKA